MNEIGIYRLPNNYSQTLIITGFNQYGTLSFSVSIQDRDIKIANIENVNWQELKEFLKKYKFIQYETHKINPEYFNLIGQVRKELYGVRPKKINSQERILLLWKRLNFKEALDLNELAIEFNVSHSQISRDIAILRRVFEYREIRYNRIDKKYELK